MANLVTNVVRTEDLRKVQKKTLNFLSEVLAKSFGPYGSYTGITKDNMETIYTKDGHTILSHVYFQNQLERAIKNDIEDITRYIVKTVGDGTTSAVILSKIIFNKLVELENSGDSFGTPAETIALFKKAVKIISKEIRKNKREATLEDIRNIALISTNNNEEIANNIYNIYKEFGMDVFIDVAVSTTNESQLKIYDGMTIEAGYADTCYITDSKKAISSIRTPNIYIFEDPIDTPNMAAFFDTIIGKNIIEPVNSGEYKDIVPTVIMAPSISPDMSTIMRELAAWLYSMDDLSRPPLLVISNIYNREQLSDIAMLCGAKTIKKYLDPKLQEADIKKGIAPDINTITEFFGVADEVVSDAYTTKVINPALMKDDKGRYTDKFKTIITFLEAELEKAKRDGQDANVTGNLKRRINSLKANMVEYLIGGISTGDRDSIRHSVEDAVLNCRSAAVNGVGYGANFEAARAIASLLSNTNVVDDDEITEDLAEETTTESIACTMSASIPSFYTMIDEEAVEEEDTEETTDTVDAVAIGKVTPIVVEDEVTEEEVVEEEVTEDTDEETDTVDAVEIGKVTPIVVEPSDEAEVTEDESDTGNNNTDNSTESDAGSDLGDTGSGDTTEDIPVDDTVVSDTEVAGDSEADLTDTPSEDDTVIAEEVEEETTETVDAVAIGKVTPVEVVTEGDVEVTEDESDTESDPSDSTTETDSETDIDASSDGDDGESDLADSATDTDSDTVSDTDDTVDAVEIGKVTPVETVTEDTETTEEETVADEEEVVEEETTEEEVVDEETVVEDEVTEEVIEEEVVEEETTEETVTDEEVIEDETVTEEEVTEEEVVEEETTEEEVVEEEVIEEETEDAVEAEEITPTISASMFMMIDIIFDAYKELLATLYANNVTDADATTIVDGCFENDKPYNIVTGEYDDTVLTSIEADPTILDGIAKIVTIMATSNQFILETPLHNVYTVEKDSEVEA